MTGRVSLAGWLPACLSGGRVEQVVQGEDQAAQDVVAVARRASRITTTWYYCTGLHTLKRQTRTSAARAQVSAEKEVVNYMIVVHYTRARVREFGDDFYT
jgi:hypothetical protein